MARFDLAVENLLKFEGDYSDNPNDSGGATKFGVSLKWYRSTVDSQATVETIKHLTKTRAIELYQDYFWRYDAILDQAVAEKIFNMAVNMGSGTAHRIIQQAAEYVSNKFLSLDGVLGPKSIAAINSCDPDALLSELRARMVVRYAEIVLQNPSQKIFLLGWMRRGVS